MTTLTGILEVLQVLLATAVPSWLADVRRVNAYVKRPLPQGFRFAMLDQAAMTDFEPMSHVGPCTASIGIRGPRRPWCDRLHLAGAATGKVKASFKNRVLENGTSDAPEETVLRTPQHRHHEKQRRWTIGSANPLGISISPSRSSNFTL